MNLIMNAIEAMESVTDRTRLLRITSNVIRESPGVLITVEDFGPGIDPKDIERIFEPFYTTKSQGMRMGLSICRSIVKAHRLIAEPCPVARVSLARLIANRRPSWCITPGWHVTCWGPPCNGNCDRQTCRLGMGPSSNQPLGSLGGYLFAAHSAIQSCAESFRPMGATR